MLDTATFCDDAVRTAIRVVLALTQPIEVSMRNHARTCRDTESNSMWWMEQRKGDPMDSIRAVAAVTSRASTLNWVGCWVPDTVAAVVGDGRLQTDADVVSAVGSYTLQLMGSRRVRTLHVLVGWSHRLYTGFEGEHTAGTVAAYLLHAEELAERTKAPSVDSCSSCFVLEAFGSGVDML